LGLTLSLAVLVAGSGEEKEESPVFPRRNAIVKAVERTGAAVINISTERIVVQQVDPFYGMRDRFFEPFFKDFFGRFGHQRKIATHSLGSGVILDRDGYIVTNEHVVRKASQIHVTLDDKTSLEASLVSADPENDIAVLKVEKSPKLKAAAIGTSADLMIGETAIALGNPFGLENSVSVGVVSAKNRSIIADGKVVYSDFIQTDAAINPGNSGGPLLNIHGEVIGINTAVHAEGQGIGFAIPIDKVVSILGDLLDYRVLKQIWVGLQLQRVTPDLSKALGAPAGGLIVTEVEKGSPAERSGLALHDLITGVGDEKVSSRLDFNKEILGHKKDDTVAIRVLRDGKSKQMQLTLAQAPKLSAVELIGKKLGIQVQEMNRLLARRLGLRAAQGLLITELEEVGPADTAGLRQLDVIIQVDRFRVSHPDHLGRLLPHVKPGTSVQFIIIRGNHFARTVLKAR